MNNNTNDKIGVIKHTSNWDHDELHLRAIQPWFLSQPSTPMNFLPNSQHDQNDKSKIKTLIIFSCYNSIEFETQNSKIKKNDDTLTIPSLHLTSSTTNLNGKLRLVMKPVSDGWPPPWGWNIVDSNINACLPSSVYSWQLKMENIKTIEIEQKINDDYCKIIKDSKFMKLNLGIKQKGGFRMELPHVVIIFPYSWC